LKQQFPALAMAVPLLVAAVAAEADNKLLAAAPWLDCSKLVAAAVRVLQHDFLQVAVADSCKHCTRHMNCNRLDLEGIAAVAVAFEVHELRLLVMELELLLVAVVAAAVQGTIAAAAAALSWTWEPPAAKRPWDEELMLQQDT
jgi:hypothetical protein